ncbi:tyrosine-type recombinase/integrase (plasmid) [Enterococcus sp. 22-H-5-01]|uniref:tyrosine-type recombinase/integrase n=1 Tax=Enterococcus sp. 22-H-5-01 TaxID=3418555 RepID=UPI003D07CFFA
MSKKGENIYKRKDLRWEGRYIKGRKENGKIQYGYIYGKSYSEVKKNLYIQKVRHQKIIELNGESAITYQSFCLDWLNKRQIILKKSTYATYLYKLKKYVFPYIGEIPLNQITRDTIQALVQTWMDQSLQASTIHVTYQIMKKPLHEAYQEEKIIQFPCKNILLPKKKKEKVRSVSRVDEKKLEIQAKKSPLVNGLPILLALKAGLRIGEIAALQWKDVDLSHRLLKIRNTYQRIPLSSGKNKSELLLAPAKTSHSVRIIPIGNNLYKWLKKANKKAKGPYVCSENLKPREPRLITYHFHQLMKKSNLSNIHFHQLRHTFATRCMESQGNITAISALLGHASTQMTLDTYTDADIISLKETISRKERLRNIA